VGSHVNLERSLAANGRVGGHFVQGHVDGVGKIIAFRTEVDSLWVTVETPESILKYIVEKGYITVDGTSLTVCDVTDTYFTFMLIKYTQGKIIIPGKKVGDLVNLEVDILGKHVERYMAGLARHQEKKNLRELAPKRISAL
jgi:riboflavin synthase